MNISENILRFKKLTSVWIIAGFFLFSAFALAASQLLPEGIDWHLTFRPAALAMLQGNSPYGATLIEAPYAGAPWGLLPLIPLAILPENIGRGFLFVISVIVFAYAAYRLGAKPVALIAFLISPPVIHCLLNANLDWYPILGFVFPPQVGLFFIAIKPQMGSVVGVFWLVEAWQRGGWREVLRIFGPFTLMFLLSLIIFGFWPLNMLAAKNFTTFWNASLWPASIPIGLALTIAAIRRRDSRYAMAASPCLSPHVLFHSWSAALIAVVASTPETVAAVLGLWILVILRALGS